MAPKLNPPLQLTVLKALLDGNVGFISDIKESVDALTGNDYSTGSIFNTLDRLEKKSLVKQIEKPRSGPGGKVRRYYVITKAGRENLFNQVNIFSGMGGLVRT